MPCQTTDVENTLSRTAMEVDLCVSPSQFVRWRLMEGPCCAWSKWHRTGTDIRDTLREFLNDGKERIISQADASSGRVSSAECSQEGRAPRRITREGERHASLEC
jgi:hypothetical protein